MAKKKAFQKSKIALFLAVMLIFCTFAVDGITCGGDSLSFGLNEGKGSLVYPGAGEFFTGSLPLQKQQSVRELSADWHGIAVLRPGRVSEGRSGLKEAQVNLGLSDGLQKVTSVRQYSMAGTAQTVQCREAIVCYIHNQDGAKG